MLKGLCILSWSFALVVPSASILAQQVDEFTLQSQRQKIEELKWESLLEAYPNSIEVLDRQRKIFRVEGSSSIVYDEFEGDLDDGRSYDEIFNDADVQDTFYALYPLDCSDQWIPRNNFDPGRFRNEDLFKGLYGNNQRNIEDNIAPQLWVKNQSIRVTQKQRVSEKLKSIAAKFSAPASQNLVKYLWPSEGAYVYRNISGTNKLSSHSFGTAIDINLKFTNYWKWEVDDPTKPIPFKNQVPCSVIEAFEKEGFVSGAKWYHYDTMHFEYRPELLLFAKKIRKEFGSDPQKLRQLPGIMAP